MRRVLSACTHNAGRSQMADAYFERHAPPDLNAQSARTDHSYITTLAHRQIRDCLRAGVCAELCHALSLRSPTINTCR
jgi:protein-tyrosine-phosphatase